MSAPAYVRQTVRLHTIEEWMRFDPVIRAEVVRNIKLKDRLYRYIVAKRKNRVVQPFWKKCRDCEGRGHILIEPRYDGIHPSQLPNPCLLKIFHEMVGNAKGDEGFEARLLLIFDLGTAVHQMFQSYGDGGAWGPHYRKEAPISAEFQPLAEALMLEGHADADNIIVIDDIPNAPIYEVGLVHEYKSINTHGFEKLTRPKPEHKMQAMLYAAALDRPIVVYMYLNKNDSNIADFPVPFEYELWEPLRKKAETLVGYYDRWTQDQARGLPGVLPPAEPGFHCKDCGHSKTCQAYKTHLAQRRA